MTLIYLACGLFVLVLASRGFQAANIARFRRSGIYPRAGCATDADVIRLVRAGRHSLAMRCHREIHGGTLAETKAAVMRLANPETE